MVIDIRRVRDSGIIPTKAYDSDAGWDLYCAEPLVLAPKAYALVKTGIAINVPEGYFGLITDRSSKSALYKVTAGVIDAGYTGEIMVAVISIFPSILPINAGEKVAQMLILPVPSVTWRLVDEFGETLRGAKGFGSSDK